MLKMYKVLKSIRVFVCVYVYMSIQMYMYHVNFAEVMTASNSVRKSACTRSRRLKDTVRAKFLSKESEGPFMLPTTPCNFFFFYPVSH